MAGYVPSLFVHVMFPDVGVHELLARHQREAQLAFVGVGEVHGVGVKVQGFGLHGDGRGKAHPETWRVNVRWRGKE